MADATTTPSTLAVHRLRFALPAAFRTPGCCDGENGMLHVRVKAPDANGKMLVRPYSAHMHPANQTFELVVKAYPGGVSEKLCALPVDAYAHVPEIRALDWRRDSKRVGMVCFGVGITECLGPAEALLKAGGEVRLVYSNRNAEQIILLDEARALLREHPGRLRLRHCLSQQGEGSAALAAIKAGKQEGEKLTRGRVDHKVLAQEFGGAWQDGEVAEHFLMIGTSDMERSVLGLLGRARLVDFSKIRGHPLFLLLKGPHGTNSDWAALSPPEPKAAKVEL